MRGFPRATRTSPGRPCGLERIPVGSFPADHHLSGMARRADLKTRRRRVRDDGWRLPDALWTKMERLLPPRPTHPLGCHNPRVPDRAATDAIFFALRTGCQWNALKEARQWWAAAAPR